MVLKSEAIVHPDEVRKYVSEEECHLSYNPQLMASLWNSLATREVKVLRRTLKRRFEVPEGCEWINYVRCHDDIGWTLADDDVINVGFSPREHRRFLTDFFTGRHEGSFARGLRFQENLITGDARVSGTCASLCGLEKALADDDQREVDLAIRRILLLHGVVITIGGIPLIFLGDEIGTLNDYSYAKDIDKQGDSRWVHRSSFDWQRAEQRRDAESVPGRIYQGVSRLIQLREQCLAFTRASTEFVETANDHVLGYFRNSTKHSALVLANFSEHPQTITGRHLRLLGLRRILVDLVTGRSLAAMQELLLEPYEFLVLGQPR